jgi:hypothetical protein
MRAIVTVIVSAPAKRRVLFIASEDERVVESLVEDAYFICALSSASESRSPSADFSFDSRNIPVSNE